MKQVYAAALLACFTLVLTPRLSGQTVSIDQGGTVDVCAGTFTDGGGSTGGHAGPGTTRTITLCSDGSDVGTHLQLDFSDLDIDGTLRVYNGPSTTSPLLRTIDRSNNGDRISLAATAANGSGCLTVQFVSAGSAPGWVADVSCIVACQPIVAELVSAAPAPVPATNGYIDLCVGETLSLNGRGRYPENNTIYGQSDATSTFTWSLGDGGEATGASVSYAYSQPGAYTAELFVTDERGCRNTNRINQRIRVAPPPRFADGGQRTPTICSGERIALTTGTDKRGPNAFVPEPQTVTFSANQTFAEQISIPDRQGEVYRSGLDVNLFDPGQQVRSGKDIESICITIEHSYLADLDIWIECPDGTRVTLLDGEQNRTVSQNHRFGYGEVDDSGPEPAETYCFTAEAAQTVFDYLFAHSGTPPVRPVLPFDRAYLPHSGNFDDLTGCTMNGEWRLNVVDNQNEDDGTVISWAIAFADNLVPDAESFTVGIAESKWEDNGDYTFYRPDSIVFTGTNPGYRNHRLSVTDDFGCTYDTLVRVDVRSPLSPECSNCAARQIQPLRDTQICLGEQIAVDFASEFSFDTTITWEAVDGRSLAGAGASVINVAHQYPDTFFQEIRAIFPQLCLDLEGTEPMTALEIRLQSPGGRTLVVVPRGSITGTNYRECIDVVTGTDFDLLSGQGINGAWTLVVDQPDNGEAVQLNRWSMDLVNRPDVTYSWSPDAADLSCADCPDPILTPFTSKTYRLTATANTGCTQYLDYRINLRSADVGYTVEKFDGCAGEENGSLRLTPLTAEPVASYAWSNGATGLNQTGLAPGIYDLTVTTEAGCDTVLAYVIEPPDSLIINAASIESVSCFGERDGAISLAVTGGYGGYTYAWAAGGSGSTNAIENLSAGNYGVSVADARGCSRERNFTVRTPAELEVLLEVTDVSCRGGADGSVEALIEGGTSPYRLRWSDASTQPILRNQPIGTYAVTVTDANGCTLSASTEVSQPEIPLSARVVNEEAGCFNTRTNRATVLARGGNGDYKYLWSNGETGETAFSLPAGSNTVQVTDKSGCIYELPFATESRPPILPTVTESAGDECRDVRNRTLEARAASGFLAYRWSTGANGSRISDLDPEREYSVTVTDAEGCRGTASYTTPAHVPLSLDIDVTPVSCFGERNGAIRVLGATNRYGTDFSYDWGVNTGYAEGPNLLDRPAANYTLTLEDAIGCRYDTTLTIPGPKILRVQETVEEISCHDATDGALAVTVTGGNGGFTYAWSDGSDASQLAGLGPGDYAITVSDAKGCSQEVRFNLTPPPAISMETVSQGPVCGGEYNGRIDVTASGGLAPLQFSLNEQRYGEASTFYGLGGGTYTVRVRDRNGCEVSEQLTIDDGPPFAVDLGEDLDIVFGDSILLVANVIGGRGELDYFWAGTYEGTLNCADCAVPVARPEYEIDYQLEVMDSLGCLAEDMLRVRVRKLREVAVPTAFTPNGDGHNDRLLVHGRPGTRVVNFSIYDRWGDFVYAEGDFPVNDAERGWDGRDHGGKEQDSGVYIFKAEIEYEDGSRETISGQTTLIR